MAKSAELGQCEEKKREARNKRPRKIGPRVYNARRGIRHPLLRHLRKDPKKKETRSTSPTPCARFATSHSITQDTTGYSKECVKSGGKREKV